MYPGNLRAETYNKPITYADQATIQTVNAGMPYYVASPKYGYEGEHIPVAGSVSKLTDINEQTGTFSTRRESTSLWVTCTASRYQFNKPFRRCSLSDDGVVHQTYSPRMAFTNRISALYYAETGKTEPCHKPIPNIYLLYTNERTHKTLWSIHTTLAGAEQAKCKLNSKCSIEVALLED